MASKVLACLDFVGKSSSEWSFSNPFSKTKKKKTCSAPEKEGFVYLEKISLRTKNVSMSYLAQVS